MSIALSVDVVSFLLTHYPTCLLYTKSDINILYTKHKTELEITNGNFIQST